MSSSAVTSVLRVASFIISPQWLCQRLRKLINSVNEAEWQRGVPNVRLCLLARTNRFEAAACGRTKKLHRYSFFLYEASWWRQRWLHFLCDKDPPISAQINRYVNHLILGMQRYPYHYKVLVPIPGLRTRLALVKYAPIPHRRTHTHTGYQYRYWGWVPIPRADTHTDNLTQCKCLYCRESRDNHLCSRKNMLRKVKKKNRTSVKKYSVSVSTEMRVLVLYLYMYHKKVVLVHPCLIEIRW